MDDLNLEDLSISPWLRYLTFRVPDANVVLVGNKWDRVVKVKHRIADDVERQSRKWLTEWIKNPNALQPHGLALEDGVSLVSCASSRLGVLAPSFGGGTGWPCDKNRPGLFHRIMRNPAGDTRAVTMCLPPSYRIALGVLEKLALCSR